MLKGKLPKVSAREELTFGEKWSLIMGGSLKKTAFAWFVPINFAQKVEIEAELN